MTSKHFSQDRDSLGQSLEEEKLKAKEDLEQVKFG